MNRYITVGQDADFTTHVIRVPLSKDTPINIIATFNEWWRATRYANALNFPTSKKGN